MYAYSCLCSRGLLTIVLNTDKALSNFGWGRDNGR